MCPILIFKVSYIFTLGTINGEKEKSEKVYFDNLINHGKVFII